MGATRARANRLANADHANLVRTSRAADEQLRAVEQLRRSGDLVRLAPVLQEVAELREDRKSTRLNSSHSQISYADFCLKTITSAIGALLPIVPPTFNIITFIYLPATMVTHITTLGIVCTLALPVGRADMHDARIAYLKT